MQNIKAETEHKKKILGVPIIISYENQVFVINWKNRIINWKRKTKSSVALQSNSISKRFFI